MPKQISVAPHLSVDELESRVNKARSAIERNHYRAIWLLAQGKRTGEVAKLTGYSRSWIYELATSYNRDGTIALGDKRRYNPGTRPLLTSQQQEELREALRGPAPEGGSWSGPKVARWMSAVLGRQVAPQRGWEYLRRLQMQAVDAESEGVAVGLRSA